METAEIYYLESHGHKVLIHCKDQDLTLANDNSRSLEQLPNGALLHRIKLSCKYGAYCLCYWNGRCSVQRKSIANQPEEASGVQSEL